MTLTYRINKERFAYLANENVGKVRRCLLSILQNFIFAVSQMVN